MKRNYRVGITLSGLVKHLEQQIGNPLLLLPLRKLGESVDRITLKKSIGLSLRTKSILFIECKTNEPENDHAILFLPYQKVIVCRNREYIRIYEKDLNKITSFTKAMRHSFGFSSIIWVYFVAIDTKKDGFAKCGTSHVDGIEPPLKLSV